MGAMGVQERPLRAGRQGAYSFGLLGRPAFLEDDAGKTARVSRAGSRSASPTQVVAAQEISTVMTNDTLWRRARTSAIGDCSGLIRPEGQVERAVGPLIRPGRRRGPVRRHPSGACSPVGRNHSDLRGPECLTAKNRGLIPAADATGFLKIKTEAVTANLLSMEESGPAL